MVLLEISVLESATMLLGLTVQCQIVMFSVMLLTAHRVDIVTNFRTHGMCVLSHQIVVYIFIVITVHYT